MTIKDLNKAKLPIVKVDKKLEKLTGKVLFPEKLERANRVLRDVGVPKSEKFERSPNGSVKSKVKSG